MLVGQNLKASDHFISKWEDRINQSDNPETKAIDMVKDWMYDHRHNLQNKETIEEGLKIKDWMDAHNIPLPAKAVAAFNKLTEHTDTASFLAGQLNMAKNFLSQFDDSDTFKGEQLPPPKVGRYSK